jgi:D-amino-acid oxidase
MATVVVVIGAGVNGLCCGIRLLEAGYRVRIVARERTPHTTSDVAAAFFLPFGVKPWGRVKSWAMAAHPELERLAKDPRSGISSISLLDVYDRRHKAPWWQEVVTEYRRATKQELPADYVDGFVTRVPLIEMPRYMPFLEARFKALGGRFEERELRAIEDLGPDVTTCVDCSGVGANRLVPDPGVFPLRGQVVRIENNGLTRGIIDGTTSRAIAHTIPRSTDVVAGGTYQKGDWSLTPDPETEKEILAKARLLEPGLDTTKILGRAVGLRPGREEIRLEVERRGPRSIVHNYGHGGAGVSLSWGCADEVVQLVRSLGLQKESRRRPVRKNTPR